MGLGFGAKMPEATLELEPFEFGVGQHGGYKIRDLRSQGIGE